MACETCTCVDEITEEQKEKIREIIGSYKGKPGVLIQVLHDASKL